MPGSKRGVNFDEVVTLTCNALAEDAMLLTRCYQTPFQLMPTLHCVGTHPKHGWYQSWQFGVTKWIVIKKWKLKQ